MAEIIKWTTDTPAFWILLEILETALYFYLVCGLLPNIRNMGRKEKIILYTVFAVTVFLSGMKYRIGSAFSSLAFFYGILLLILGTWIAYRKNLLLISGLVMAYNSFILLLIYLSAFVLSLLASGTKIPVLNRLLADGGSNTIFCLLCLCVLALLFPFVKRLRRREISGRIREYEKLLLILGIILSVLVLEYQNVLEYGFYYLLVSIPAVTDALRNSLLSLVTSAVLLAAAGILLFKNRIIRNENNLLLMKDEMEQQKYQEIRAAVEKNRELVHDAKNHYLLIGEYLRSKDYESLENYVTGLQENFVRTDSWVYTGNHVLDLILGQKRMIAEKKGIFFEIQATPLSRLPFQERELCSLFGNLLDNAIEACERVTEKGEKDREGEERPARKIQVKIQQRGQMLFVEIVNSMDQIPERKNRRFLTRKKNPSLHGYGLKSVERIVEEHEGVISYEAKDGRFKATVVFFDVE